MLFLHNPKEWDMKVHGFFFFKDNKVTLYDGIVRYSTVKYTTAFLYSDWPFFNKLNEYTTFDLLCHSANQQRQIC